METDTILGMTTTAGAYALRNATARKDAFLVAKTKETRPVILGKANLAVSISLILVRQMLINLQELNGFMYATSASRFSAYI
jgi:hypothetical protein